VEREIPVPRCSANCIPFSVQESFVHAETEAPDFERSLVASLGGFPQVSSGSTSVEIDLEQTVPDHNPAVSSSAFHIPLQSGDPECAIDLE